MRKAGKQDRLSDGLQFQTGADRVQVNPTFSFRKPNWLVGRAPAVAVLARTRDGVGEERRPETGLNPTRFE